MKKHIAEGRSTVGATPKNEAEATVQGSGGTNKKIGKKAQKKAAREVALDAEFD